MNVDPLRRMSGLALCVVGAALAAGATDSRRDADPQAERARRWREALRPELRERVSFAFDDERRREWQYHYYDWPGVALGELNESEAAGFDELLRAALSERGLAKVNGVRRLQQLLHEESGLERSDPGLYSIALWGAPDDVGRWGWRLAGHHLALSFTLAGNEVATTPFFLGAHPAEIRDGPDRGLRVLEAEERLARELLASLSEEQRALAYRAEGRPNDVLFGPGRELAQVAREGIAGSQLAPEQRARLEALLHEYVGNLRSDLAERELARIRERGLDAVHFLWIGAADPGETFYYRLHGAHFVIELDVVSENHVHALWRDLDRDFGADLLRLHREEEGR